MLRQIITISVEIVLFKVVSVSLERICGFKSLSLTHKIRTCRYLNSASTESSFILHETDAWDV